MLGTRLADAVVLVVELLGEAAYAGKEKKYQLLAEANRRFEVVRWLVRLTSDRNLISKRQFLFSCRALEECGRMVGGWQRSLEQRPMKRHKHLWGKMISLENLADAARAAMRGKRSTLSGAAFFGQWETEVVMLERELREGSYAPGDYHYFEITIPSPG